MLKTEFDEMNRKKDFSKLGKIIGLYVLKRKFGLNNS